MIYVTLITVACFVLYKTHLNEGGMIGRLRRETSQPHVEAIYSRYKKESHGEATYYGNYPGGGACSLDPLSPMSSQPGWIRVAAGSEDFQNSLGCGMCLEITGTGKGKGSDPVTGTLRGIVHDLCGGCKQGDLDLYIPGDGRWEISFKAINCPTVGGSDGNIMLKFTGSNPWYIKLQARNTRVPVAGIEVLKNGKYSCLKRVNDNYFVGDGLGKVDFPMQVRLTAVTGEQRESIIPTMKNDQNTLTDIQFTGQEASGGPPAINCLGQGNKPPYPSGGMKPGSTGVPPTQPTTGPSPAPAPAPAPVPVPAPPTYPPSPENANFCKRRKGGTYADPDRCSGFIICNIGNTHRMSCGDGLMFNTNGMNCDLPARVDCGDRPLDSPKGNQEDVQGQYGDQVQEGMSHKQSIKMQAEQPIWNHDQPIEGKANEPLHFGQGISRGDTDIHFKPIQMREHDSNSVKQPLSSTNLPSRDFEDKVEADETPEPPSIQLGLDFGENRKQDKSDDSTQTDSKHEKANNPKEPVLHVLINGNTNVTPMSSLPKTDDETGSSRPSFQLMVNKDGIKASLDRSEGERMKMDDNSHSESNANNPKHTLHLVINNDQRKRVNDEVEDSNSGARLEEVTKGEKAQRLNGANKAKEPGMDIELLPLLPLYNRDQPFSRNASQNIKTTTTKYSSDNITGKAPVIINNDVSKVPVQSDSNIGKEGKKNVQNNTSTNNQEKSVEIIKPQVKVIALVGTNIAQQTNHPTISENITTGPLKPFPLTTAKTEPRPNLEEGLSLKESQAAFKQPIKVANQQQAFTEEEKQKQGNAKSDRQEGPNKSSSETKIGNEPSRKNGDITEKVMDSSDVTVPQNTEGQEKVKRPTVDILVNGDSGIPTNLRLRNSNSEIARLNDASGKLEANRNPVIGITIRQKGSRDHHILFSKRQRLSNDKHVHHHHKHH